MKNIFSLKYKLNGTQHVTYSRFSQILEGQNTFALWNVNIFSYQYIDSNDKTRTYFSKRYTSRLNTFNQKRQYSWAIHDRVFWISRDDGNNWINGVINRKQNQLCLSVFNIYQYMFCVIVLSLFSVPCNCRIIFCWTLPYDSTIDSENTNNFEKKYMFISMNNKTTKHYKP